MDKTARYQGDANYGSVTSATATFVISKKTLMAVITPDSKVYDGTKTAAINTLVANGVIVYSGIVNNDDVSIKGGTLTFTSKDVAAGIGVTASGYTIDGSKSGNYALGSVSSNSASITEKGLTVSTPQIILGKGQPVPASLPVSKETTEKANQRAEEYLKSGQWHGNKNNENLRNDSNCRL